MIKIKYNSQRDNFDFAGEFPAWKQCFSTCAFMFLSYYCSDIDGDDDIMLSRYIDDVEVKVGREGIGEKIFSQMGFSSFWWYVQAAGIQKWLDDRNVTGKIKFENTTLSYNKLHDIMDSGQPIILGTNKLGGLSGGHIILLVDSVLQGFIVHDPFGNANTEYEDIDGEGVLYRDSFLLPHTVYKNPDKVRCIYLKEEDHA